jgi:hypothetical protein
MKPRFVLPWTIAFVGGLLIAPSAPGEGYARVCVTSLDADSAETVLAAGASPTAGKKLIVHLDSSVECTALIVPLMEKDSRLANGWRPQVVLLPQWTEKTLPDPSSAWEWRKTRDSFDLWIFFFKRDAAGFEEIQKLVAAMQNLKVSNQVLAQQTRRLCKMLSSRMSGDAPIPRGPKANPTLVGGTKRRIDFPWRDYAQKVLLNDTLEGELVVRHGQ